MSEVPLHTGQCPEKQPRTSGEGTTEIIVTTFRTENGSSQGQNLALITESDLAWLGFPKLAR
jgi:hypothetical protein